jgi:hypothetical protein
MTGGSYTCSVCLPSRGCHAVVIITTLLGWALAALQGGGSGDSGVYYPLFSGPIAVHDIRRSSLRVNVTIDRAGTVYCGVLPSGATMLSVLDIQSVASDTIAPTGGEYSVAVERLSADTRYDVYCYTADFQNHAMSTASAVSTKTAITTACCRSLTVLKKYPSVVPYPSALSIQESVFQIGFSAPPSTWMDVRLTIYQKYSCDADDPYRPFLSQVATANPTGFSFDPNTSSAFASPGIFTVRSSRDKTCLVIEATSSSSSPGAEYYEPVQIPVRVRPWNKPPDPPQLQSVSFSSEGSALLIDFDSDTDQGSSKIVSYGSAFDCSTIMIFADVGSTKCKWLSSSQIFADIGSSGAQPNVGESFFLMNGVLRTAVVRGKWDLQSGYNEASNTTISSPPSSPKPVRPLSSDILR